MAHPWRVELARIAALLLAALFISRVFGHSLYSFLLAVLIYLAWHLLQIRRLERGLSLDKRFSPPDVGGIWGEIFRLIYARQKRHRKRKRKLSSILDRFKKSTAAMPDATVVLGGHGEIEWLNGAAARLLDLKSPQDIGQCVVNLVRHPDFIAYFKVGNYEHAVEIPAPHDDQIQLSIRIVPYGAGQRLLLARDVTPLHRLESVRRDFVANASHELRTPLTVVRGYIETLRDADDPYMKQWDRSLEQVEQQVGRMQRIIEDLLTLSRLESEAFEEDSLPADVPRLLAGLAEDARRLSGARGHIIQTDIDSELMIYGDEEALRSAFSNLIVNAVQYTPNGEHITIRWYRDADGARFEVADSGEGIPADHIPRLTERFYRVDLARSRKSGGTGLGLAIAKHALARHGASLQIESVVGQGSTFICEFSAERIAQVPAGSALTKP